ncbi:MAG: (Fe-S)-binding protein [Geminicoccaceae bacterium]
MSETPQRATPKVGLFVTCLVDAIRPNIGFAALKLLEDAGCQVSIPKAQTCCGQPAFNSGDDDDARAIVKRIIDVFEPYDYLVAPSGSCAGQIKVASAELFHDEPAWAARHAALAAKTYEILSFLDEVMAYAPKEVRYEGTGTYHDSCSGLRELGISAQPRRLLRHVEGLTMVPLEGHNVCCGFGGTFAVKYSDISGAIVTDKVRCIERSGADTLICGDLGCLMNMAGRLSRLGSKVKVYHTIEILAGMADGPALCQEG